jgi:hypothetical protein
MRWTGWITDTLGGPQTAVYKLIQRSNKLKARALGTPPTSITNRNRLSESARGRLQTSEQANRAMLKHR